MRLQMTRNEVKCDNKTEEMAASYPERERTGLLIRILLIASGGQPK